MISCETDLISVIIPVYNAEKYILECVESVLNQSYGKLQIILVDDGSTDRSATLCDELAEKDSRIQVIHRKNGGSSAARNSGIAAAVGEFIFFVDADDYLDKNAIEVLHQLICEKQTEIALGNAKEFGIAGKERITVSAKEGVISGLEVLNMPGKKDAWLYIAVWNKLFRKQLFEEIRFPDGLAFEDEYIYHEIFKPEYKIACTEDALYHYRINADSITRKSFHLKKLDIVEGYYHRFLFLYELNLKGIPKELLDVEKQMLHIETAGFQYLQKAYFSLSAKDRKSPVLKKRVAMDKEMVNILSKKKIISGKSRAKRVFFYLFPRVASIIAWMVKR